MALTKEQILGCSDIETREVDIPQWGGKILLRSLNGLEREQLEGRIQKFANTGSVSKKGVVRAVSLIMTAVDEQGNFLFTLDDAETLALKSAAPLDIAFDVILEMNHMSKKDAEDLEKNLEETETDGSGSS